MNATDPTAGLTVWAEIDLDALEHNVRTLRARAPKSDLMAVVKADAYGHGLLPVARAAVRAGASWLGVAQFAEAFALRDAGITTRLLTWLSVPGSDFAGARRAVTSTCPPPRHGRSTRSPPPRASRAVPPASTSRSTPGWAAAEPMAPTGPPCSATPGSSRQRGSSPSSGSGRTSRSPTPPSTRPCSPSRTRSSRPSRSRRRSASSRGPAPRELGGDARPPIGPRRPRPAGDRHLRLVAGPTGGGRLRPATGHDAPGPTRPRQAGAGRAGHQLRPRLPPGSRHVASGSFPPATPTASLATRPTSGRSGSGTTARPSPAACAWTSSSSTSARRARLSPATW